MAAPATPNNVYVQQGNSQVYVSADITAGATSYPVLRSTDGVTFVEIAAPSSPSYLDTSVTENTQYYYQLKARNSSGDSNASASQGIIPTATAVMSLGAVRLLSQQTADRVNSNFVTLPEWNTYINQSYFELYDLLVTLYEDYFLALPYTFTTVGNQSSYDLPSNFYKLMGVDCGQNVANESRVNVNKFNFIDRNKYVYPSVTNTFFGVFNLRYRVLGGKLHFIPVPSAGQIITVWFIPKLVQLLQDTDVVDGVSGWTEYIVVDAAIKALEKEESDTTALMVRKAALLKRIEDSGSKRDAGQPDTVSDVRSTNGFGTGWGPNGGGSFGGYQ